MEETSASFFLSIQIFFPVYALINSSRIGLAFFIFDPDKEPEPLFYISLVGIALSYIIFGVFSTQITLQSANPFGSVYSLAVMIALLASIILLFADKQTWDKSTPFVRIRISLSLFHIIILIINPIIGIISNVIILPFQVLIDDGQNELTKTQKEKR